MGLPQLPLLQTLYLPGVHSVKIRFFIPPQSLLNVYSGNITLSVAADMFSYAGVFFNMLFKEHTWPKDSKPADVLKQIKAGQRPKIPQDLLEKEDMKWIVDIIQGCWKLDPTERPSATSVFKTICLNREKKYKK
jgi:serine/threonine protein kinase